MQWNRKIKKKWKYKTFTSFLLKNPPSRRLLTITCSLSRWVMLSSLCATSVLINKGGLHSRFKEVKSLKKRVRVTKADGCREGQILMIIITVQVQNIQHRIFLQFFAWEYRKPVHIPFHLQFRWGIHHRYHLFEL